MKIALVSIHACDSPQAIPLAAASLLAALPENLRSKGKLFDQRLDQPAGELIKALIAFAPDLVSFSVAVWNRERVIEIARSLRAAIPGLSILCGGPEGSGDPVGLADATGADGVVLGEGESLFADCCTALTNQQPLPASPSLYRPGDDPATLQPAIEDPVVLRSPWLTGTFPPDEGAGLLWETARGCTFNCDYCFDARGGAGVRRFEDSRLAAELDLFRKQGVSRIWVLDSTFNADLPKAKQLLRLIAKHGGGIHFQFEGIAEQIDGELATLLSGIPCFLQIGLQADNPDLLRALHRPYHRERFRRGIHQLNLAGVPYGLDLMYGLPGDTLDGYRSSLNAAIELLPNHLDLFPLCILPGTRLQRRAVELGIRHQNHPPYRVVETEKMSPADLATCAELTGAVEHLYNDGRAVPYFMRFCDALGMSPVEIADDWLRWSKEETRPHLLIDELTSFYTDLFTRRKKRLAKLAGDILRYNHLISELGFLPSTAEGPRAPQKVEQLLKGPLKTADTILLADFTYELVDLDEAEGLPLTDFASQFKPVGSCGIFYHRDGELYRESLDPDFAKLLKACRTGGSPQEILRGLKRDEIVEIVRFAVGEGLLRYC